MKTIMKLQAVILFAMFAFASCKKDETRLYYEDGTPPVLTASDTSALVLLKDNAANEAIIFSWTNPDYQFNTGVSSQDVTYTLQVDTVGANFSSPNKQELTISKSLSVTYTVQQLNTILTKLNVAEDVPHEIEFRIKSSLGNNSVSLTSNSIKKIITPYLDVAVPIPPTGVLYITGSAVQSDWTNTPPETQQCEKVSNVEYKITVHLTSGKQYKFLSTLGSWQPQYGVLKGQGDAKSGTIGYNFGLAGQTDPEAFNTPDAEGDYEVDLNFKTGKYTVTKQ